MVTDASVCSVLSFHAPGRNADPTPTVDRPLSWRSLAHCIKALLPCLSRRYVVGGRSPLVPFFRHESLFPSEHLGARLAERTWIYWTHPLLLAKCKVRLPEMLVCDSRSQVV